MYLLDTSLRQFALDALDSLVPRSGKIDRRTFGQSPQYYTLVSEKVTVDDVEKRSHPFMAVGGVLLLFLVLLYALID